MNHKPKRHLTDEQKKQIMRNVQERMDQGILCRDACVSNGIFSAQFYKWRKELAGKPEGESRVIKTKNTNNEKTLRIENQRLKMIVAEQALDIQALKEWGAR